MLTNRAWLPTGYPGTSQLMQASQQTSSIWGLNLTVRRPCSHSLPIHQASPQLVRISTDPLVCPTQDQSSGTPQTSLCDLEEGPKVSIKEILSCPSVYEWVNMHTHTYNAHTHTVSGDRKLPGREGHGLPPTSGQAWQREQKSAHL